MSVIVKGMEMPENCGECRLMTDFWCYAKMVNGQPGPTFMDRRPDWCPLRPLPEKHGRLVDADALSDEYALMTCEIHGFRIEPLGVGDEHAKLKFKPWREVPTIVEAEGHAGRHIEHPTPKMGHWVEDQYGYNRCSECGYEHGSPEYVTPFCPGCGAHMEDEE